MSLRRSENKLWGSDAQLEDEEEVVVKQKDTDEVTMKQEGTDVVMKKRMTTPIASI